MEKMYQDYKDIVEFRMIYIKEAHAADGRRPMGAGIEKNITEHKDYEQRCATAEMLISDEELTIPTLIDEMDDSINRAYFAFPDRVFLVRSDGRLAVAANRGPWGFAPALEETAEWLTKFRESGAEPDLPDGAIEAATKRAADKAAKEADSDSTEDDNNEDDKL